MLRASHRPGPRIATANPRVSWAAAGQFEDRPGDQAGNAVGQLAGAFDQRDGERELRADADQRAGRDDAAFLRAYAAGQHEADAAPRLAETLQHHGLGRPDRMAEQPERQPDLGAAPDPADQAPAGAAREPDAVAITGDHFPIEGARPADQPLPRPAARHAFEQAGEAKEQAAVLHEDEAEHYQGEEPQTGAEAEQPLAAAANAYEEAHPEQDESELRGQSRGQIHHDACARDRSTDAGAGQEVRTDDVAADLSGRKQAVDRAADPPRDHHRAEPCALETLQEGAPAERVGEQ